MAGVDDVFKAPEPKTLKASPPKIFPIQDVPDIVKECAEKIWEKHGVPDNKDHILFTYYQGIYTSFEMTQDLYRHECIHYIRQGFGQDKERADAWLRRYAEDEAFRYDEEIYAYREQYQFILSKSSRPVAFEHAKRFAVALSGPMYGYICNFQKALFDITRETWLPTT